MNEQLKRRGFAHNKILATVAICALFLSGSPVMTYATEAPAVQEVQQTTSITITVVDSKGEPIIGANVLQKGTTNGGTTDLDGKVTLTLKPGVVIQISYVGYFTHEMKVTKDTRVVLMEDTELLD